MSIEQDCAACVSGDHSRHDRDHGIRKGLIGGSYCPCTGECEDRPAQTLDQLMEQIGADPDVAKAMAENARVARERGLR